MFHVKHEAWALDLRKLGSELDDDRLDSLSAYEAALRERAVPKGFVSAGDAERLWELSLHLVSPQIA